jgi:hypothetical protein
MYRTASVNLKCLTLNEEEILKRSDNRVLTTTGGSNRDKVIGECRKLHKEELPTVNRILLDELTVSQLVREFPPFYGTRRFITMFRRTRHWSLS